MRLRGTRTPTLALLTTLLTTSIATLVAVVAGAAPAGAVVWDPARALCTVNDSRINETSGIARSTYPRAIRWVHNDSGDSARLFAITKTCGVKARIKVALPQPQDWEDMAVGPKHTLWLGDIGDNGQKRSEISVVRIREPRSLHNQRVKATVFRLAYPDGAHNAEGMMVRPRGGRVYVVTKSKVEDGGAVYRAPRTLSPTGINVMTKVLSGAPRGLSSADWHPSGKGFFLGSYHSIFVYESMTSAPVEVPFDAPVDFNEAAGWNRPGTGVLLTGEGVGKPIWLLSSR